MKLYLLAFVGLEQLVSGQNADNDPAQQNSREENTDSIDDISVSDKLPPIAESEFCAAQVQKLCPAKRVRNDDYLVYNCLEIASSEGKLVDEQCQHFLWIWKHSQTESGEIQKLVSQKCPKDVTSKIASECTHHYDEPFGAENKLIPCLMDYRLEITEDASCRSYLTDISKVVFSDFRLICNFVNQCKDDIFKYSCGRNDFGQTIGEDESINPWLQQHSQGAVVQCLENHLGEDDDISDSCQRELVNLAELSADDFTLDRAFYMACRDDRDSFSDCAEIPAGDGKVYSCLFRHKFDKAMTEDCQKAISIRERLIYSADYKASNNLHKQCRKSFRQFGCDTAEIDNLQMGGEFAGLSDILMCVEKKLRKDKKDKNGKLLAVEGSCDSQLLAYRQFLMEDFSLSPEVVSACKIEIKTYCEGGIVKGGETLHCLMGLDSDPEVDEDISDDCEDALYELIEETEADDSFKVDKRLEHLCSPIAAELCKDSNDDDSEVLSCLLENLHSHQMVQEHPLCRKSLLETQYFLSRDFSWDKKFRRACHEDAEELCNVGTFNEVDDEEELPIPLSMVIGCLYRHSHPFEEDVGKNGAGKTLKGKCAEQVHRVMKQRAMEVELNPQLEAACRPTLGSMCSEEDAVKKVEFLCLQDHYEDMKKSTREHDQECAEQVAKLTQIASEDLDLEQVLFASCEPMVEKFCKPALKSEDEGKVLGCLINHKNEQEMDEKCQAGVLHFQIISMTDYKLGFAFFKSCKKDIQMYCHDKAAQQSKPQIVHCLSERIRDAVLSESSHDISDVCRSQVNFELLSESEDVRLRPEIIRACALDIKVHCGDTKPGAGRIEECLKEKKDDLSNKCAGVLFEDIEIEADNPTVDYFLVKACKPVIHAHCGHAANMKNVMPCLIEQIGNDLMSKECRMAVKARQMMGAENIKLNPQLSKACHLDIQKVCPAEFGEMKQLVSELKADMNSEKGALFEGRVISCLKNNFIKQQASKDNKLLLSKNCASHVENLMKQEIKNFELDPELKKFCNKGPMSPLKIMCSPESVEDPIECLKEKFNNEELKDSEPCRIYIGKLIQEGEVDVNIDTTLQNACGTDLKMYCTDVEAGHGRRINCLVTLMKKKPKSLSEPCLDKLHERRDMWQKAQSMKIEGVEDLYYSIQKSHHANYLFGILAGICLILVGCGMSLGRITARAKERKAL